MNRRTFLTNTCAAMLLTPLLSTRATAVVPLEELSAYFNGIRTLQARFVQVNDDGSRSTGTLYIRRPGRARFEYDPPEKSLVMAGGGQVAIFDGRSNASTPEQYPLKRTPLWLILERSVDLNRRETITGHFGDDKTTRLVAQDPEAPENGRVELIFQNTPLTLAGWTLTDGGGSQTEVSLQEIRLGGQLSARLFNIVQEQEARGR